MAERESLSAQTERLAALMNKRRGGPAGVGASPKVEAAAAPVAPPVAPPPPPPVAPPVSVVAAPAPAPVAPPEPVVAAPPRQASPPPAPPFFRDSPVQKEAAAAAKPQPQPQPQREPEAASAGGDSLSAYFRSLGLEDPFQSGGGGSSASLEDLLAIPERARAAAPAPEPAPSRPAAAAAPAPEAARPSAAIPVAPEPAPFKPVAAAPEPAPFRPAPAIPLAPEPAFAFSPQAASQEDEEDSGDFLDQVAFGEPAPHARHEPAPFKPAPAPEPPPSPPPPPPPLAAEGGPLDDPSFWEVAETPEEEEPIRMGAAPELSASASAAKRAEAERHLSVFDSEPASEPIALGGRTEPTAEPELEFEPERAVYEEEPSAPEEAAEGADEAYAAELPVLEEGEMLMPIDAQRAEMIRHLASTMGCAPEDVVVTALDWYLDALMNAETSGDDAAA